MSCSSVKDTRDRLRLIIISWEVTCLQSERNIVLRRYRDPFGATKEKFSFVHAVHIRSNVYSSYHLIKLSILYNAFDNSTLNCKLD